MKQSQLMQPEEKNFQYYFGIFGEFLIILGMYLLPIIVAMLAAYGLYVLIRFGVLK